MASTTSDLGLLGRKLGATDYDPDVYVKEISQRCVGGHELHQQRNNIQTLAEDTNAQLKKNVYQNYGQFIETSKEITYLESEMYQLAHMITEQRNLLHELMECSVLGDKVHQESGPSHAEPEKESNPRSDFEEGRRQLYELLEKVEGCSHVLDVPSRHLLHDGDLVELDAAENTALHRVHGYLVNDGFMVATWLPNRRGPVRFKFSCLYELDSLAVVNVRDRDFGGVKCAFKLLVFPEARLFQCANADAKSGWMEAFEGAKRNQQKHKEEFALRRTDTVRKSVMRNPFGNGDAPDDEDDECGEESNRMMLLGREDQMEQQLPEWVREMADDLEVFIAQREFEEAVDLIHKGTEFCTSHSESPLVREAGVKLEAKKKQLIQVLTQELKAEKSLRGGPRAARRAVQLLVRLDRSTLACDLYLQHRAAILQSALRDGKLEIATIAYVQHQSATFFKSISESSVEFCKVFQSSSRTKGGKYASFLVWVEDQLSTFCRDRIEKQVFSPSTPLETISTCIEIVRNQACKLRDKSSLDIVFIFDSKFQRNVERYICEARDKHVEAVKLRAQEDKWMPINCFNKSGTDRFVDEMSAAGIPSVCGYVYDECWVALTRNSTSFSISYLNLVDSLLKLISPSTRALVNDSVVAVFHSHLRHFEQAVKSERLKTVDAKFVRGNATFLLETILPLVERKYTEKTGSECPKLGKLTASYSWLKDGSEKPPSSSRSTKQNNGGEKSDPNYV